jgi:hypothetical protein
MPPRISITRLTDPKRAGQHAIHAGVRRQGGTERLQPLTKGRLQVPGDGDHDRGWLPVDQLVDQCRLLFWSQGGLQDDHLVAIPAAGARIAGGNRLHRYAEPTGCGPNALREQEIVFDDVETPGHGCRIAG